MFHILLVAIGGAIGSVARYLAGLGMTRLMGMSFPWGTLTVNIVGSFAIGILTELGLLERTESGGVCCPYMSMHIDMHLKAA